MGDVLPIYGFYGIPPGKDGNQEPMDSRVMSSCTCHNKISQHEFSLDCQMVSGSRFQTLGPTDTWADPCVVNFLAFAII